MRDLALTGKLPIPPGIVSRLRRGLPAFVKGVIRRQADNYLPNRDAREYKSWISNRLAQRSILFQDEPPQGLLSVLTPVWDGSPVAYLKKLAESIIGQNKDGASEWVILDNGCTVKELGEYLKYLGQFPWIKLQRTDSNIGIIGGLQACLAAATHRYVLPVDADDYLYPDTFRVLASTVRKANHPALLYSDEDKVIGTRVFQPYLKPDWDPVLFLNSAYIAHLGVIDREKAIELGAYSDRETEGSPDWDLFLRFMLAGHEPVHIPEVLYSWRVHAKSTADDAANKPYIHSSQKAVLQRFLNSRSDRSDFSVEYSPFLNGSAHWRFERRNRSPRPVVQMVLLRKNAAANVNTDGVDITVSPRALLPQIMSVADADGLVCLKGEDVQISNPDWLSDALTIFQLNPDAAMIGGRITNGRGTVTEAGHYFGFDGACGDPNQGRSSLDPGYFGQMWKQRSVSAVSSQFSVIKARFLREVLESLHSHGSLAYLGAWAGAHALRTGKRVVYSPFLSATSNVEWMKWANGEEALFASINADLIPDRRFYSPSLSLREPFAPA